jgi:hypothetical protein
MRAWWIVAVAFFLAGCAAEPSPTPAESAFFPRHSSPLGTGHLALLEGPLVFEDGCLWIKPADGDRFLVLWPSDTTLGKINNKPVVLGPQHLLLAETGDITLLGGNGTDLETALRVVPGIPKACAGEAFWIASMVDTRT